MSVGFSTAKSACLMFFVRDNILIPTCCKSAPRSQVHQGIDLDLMMAGSPDKSRIPVTLPLRSPPTDHFA